MSEPRSLVEHFFRHEFGRLCAVLTRSLGVRRLALVEDVVQAALVQTLETWSRRGVPEDPASWLPRLGIQAIWSWLGVCPRNDPVPSSARPNNPSVR
jgi:predicted RNA polymerase sigma factor